MIKHNNNERKSTLRRRPLLIVIIIIAILVLSLIIGKILVGLNKNNSEQNTVENSKQVQNNTEQPKTEEVVEPDSEKPKVIQNEGVDPNTLDELTGVVTSAQVNNGKAMIRVSVDQYLSSGDCVIELTSGEDKYSELVPTVGLTSASTCAGFDIPVEKLHSGLWSFNIFVSSGEKVGTISGEIEL